jgi:FAD/FMN-containing dehydrogenase
MIATDVCVPISRLAECIAATQEDVARATMPIPLFGHVGDGNFHLMILVDPDSEADVQEAWDLNTRLVRRASPWAAPAPASTASASASASSWSRSSASVSTSCGS